MRHGIHIYGFVGPGWILDRKEIIGEAVKYLCSIEFVVDLGGPCIHLYGFLGPGWILDRKEILGEPVKWLNSTETVMDLGGPWIHLYDFLGLGRSWIERKLLVNL